MKAETLSGIVGSLCGDHSVVATPSVVCSVGKLLEHADELYRRSSVTTASRVALSGLSALSLMTGLVAFDGKVEAMLLLPVALDEATFDRLIASAGCTHLMDADGIRTLPNCLAGDTEFNVEGTQWLLATSGTTGTPKLICHTLASITRSVKRDRTKGAHFVWGLLYETSRFAGLQVVLQALFSGSLLIASESSEFDSQIEAFVRHGVNALSATPSLWRKMLMDARIKACPLRQITLGGEIADQQILDALRRSFPAARIVHIYASTEAGVAFSVNDCCAGFPAAWLRSEHSPIPLRIRDDGHLLIKPAKLPDGQEIARRLDADGYLDTTDIVYVEGDRVFFSGRASGAINVGGNKVIPEFVEQHLRCVDGVLDVHVFGKKNSIIGQLVAVKVVARSGVDTALLRGAIIGYCKVHLEKWQIPGVIFFVAELKESMAGKRERVV
ncbi:long-chain fatty acid--CoA ligase [Chlorobaculum thiosulfatiphilum]|uniref:Long-chain fatty acid--CoA ligase n=1 Tax=Chlorobaculum thiosulfatiphilum TaxID=115852 RepID=A0A5C4S546_CHLTI|nr:AMP-binding protein [Chlorobaculum thiosulfatiphilum]TNJ38566.1 long-chain fatty acid--CoA ligase [Chlorobaculum thiosulfatiphilum]